MLAPVLEKNSLMLVSLCLGPVYDVFAHMTEVLRVDTGENFLIGGK